jgi:uncharacterized membrane protein YkvA (DUF1232 family)
MANKNLYYAGMIGIVALALTYVFWGADVIPDAIATLGPGAIAAWFDDAIVIIAGIFALAKWRQFTLGGKKQKGVGWKGAAIFIPVVIGGLLYVFWAVDLIPDAAPYIGWFDDAAAVMIMFFTLGRIRKRLRE